MSCHTKQTHTRHHARSTSHGPRSAVHGPAPRPSALSTARSTLTASINTSPHKPQAHTARQDRKRRAKPTAPEQRNSGTAAVRSRPPSTSRPPHHCKTACEPTKPSTDTSTQYAQLGRIPHGALRRGTARPLGHLGHLGRQGRQGRQGQHSITTNTNCR